MAFLLPVFAVAEIVELIAGAVAVHEVIKWIKGPGKENVKKFAAVYQDCLKILKSFQTWSSGAGEKDLGKVEVAGIGLLPVRDVINTKLHDLWKVSRMQIRLSNWESVRIGESLFVLINYRFVQKKYNRCLRK